MTKTKKILMTAAGLFVVGAVLTCIGFALGGSPATVQFGSHGLDIRPSHVLNEQKYQVEKMEKTPIDAFSALDVDVRYADFTVIPSDGYYLEYRMVNRQAPPEWKSADGTFSFRTQDHNQSNEFQVNLFYFNLGSDYDSYEYVKLYVPEEEFSSWKIKSAHGDVTVRNVRTGDFEADIQYGELRLEQASMPSCSLTQRHGDLYLEEIVTDRLIMSTEYSEISLADINAADLQLERGRHGSLTARNVKSGTFFSDTEYVNIELTKFATAGIRMDSDHGEMALDLQGCKNINITSTYTGMEIRSDQNIREYMTDINLDYGEISINGESFGEHYKTDGDGGGTLVISSRHGDVELSAR